MWRNLGGEGENINIKSRTMAIVRSRVPKVITHSRYRDAGQRRGREMLQESRRSALRAVASLMNWFFEAGDQKQIENDKSFIRRDGNHSAGTEGCEPLGLSHFVRPPIGDEQAKWLKGALGVMEVEFTGSHSGDSIFVPSRDKPWATRGFLRSCMTL